MKLLNNNESPLNPNELGTPPPSSSTPSQTPVTDDTNTSSSVVDHVQMGSDGQKAATNEQALIQKLLQDKQAGTRKISKVGALNDGKNRSLSAHDLASMRYKIFSIGLLILGVIIWSNLLHPLINTYASNRQTLAIENNKIQTTLTTIEQAKKLDAFARTVDSLSGTLTDCINSNTDCGSALTKLTAYESDKATARKQSQYYLQIGDLSDPKLWVDEKSILTNIDLFLLRTNSNNRIGNKSFGEVKEIIIGDPTPAQGKMHSVSIELIINFPDDGSLISFLNNAENRIISNDTIQLPPILYKVEEVSYDIANYNEAQDATIKLIAYYYTD